MNIDECKQELALANVEIGALNNELTLLRVALNRYRYAVAFANADAWDGGLDIRQRFAWARANDPGGNLSDNEVAAIACDFHGRAADPGEWRNPG